LNLSRSKQKNARALNPRSLLSLEKKTRKKKKKKKGTPRVVDRRGVLLLHQTEPDPSFVRARAFVLLEQKKNEAFFQGNFFFFFEEEEEGQKKENMKSVLLARFELAISRLLSGRLNL
jgi:hypothetical protein